VSTRWVTPDQRVIDVINITWPSRGGVTGPQFRIRDIHGHWLGRAVTVPELEEKLGVTIDKLEEL
jgi:hypothetical protein